MPIRLGEWTLLQPGLHLLVWRQGLFEPPITDATIALERLPPHADGFMVTARVDAVGQMKTAPGLIRYLRQRSPRYYVKLEGTYEEYLNRFSAKTRSSLKRKARRLEKEVDGRPVQFREYTGGEFEEFYRAARSVSSVTYQERMFDAGLPTAPEAVAELERAMRDDGARGYVLFIGDEAVAYLFCPIRDGVAEYQYVGYRPEHSRLSPGTVLLLWVLERLFPDEAVRAFDFTEGAGEGSHKEFYATDSVEYEIVYWLRRRPRNICVTAAAAKVEWFSGAMGHILDRFGLKRPVKRFVRLLRGA